MSHRTSRIWCTKKALVLSTHIRRGFVKSFPFLCLNTQQLSLSDYREYAHWSFIYSQLEWNFGIIMKSETQRLSCFRRFKSNESTTLESIWRLTSNESRRNESQLRYERKIQFLRRKGKYYLSVMFKHERSWPKRKRRLLSTTGRERLSA